MAGNSTGSREGKKTVVLSGEVFRVEESREDKVKNRLTIAERLSDKFKEILKDADIIRICHVSRSSFNERRKARKEAQEKEESEKEKDNSIKEMMRQIMKKLCCVPGERTFKTYLWRLFDVNAGRKLIRRLMNEMNISATVRRKDAYKGDAKHDHACTAPDNLVNQNFRVKPRHIICTDITYLYYGLRGSLLYLCVFKDAYTKEILGWKVADRMTVELIQDAYDKMMEHHGKELKTEEVLVHSDQGSQYLSTTFKELLKGNGFYQSVSARANSQDNAPAESFFALAKTTLLPLLKLCPAEKEAVEMIDGYINSYNNEQYQYNLAGLTPHEFYEYKMTGIYPCDNYYGLKAERCHTLEEIINDKMTKAKQRADKARAKYQERSRTSQLLKKNPVDMIISDQGILQRTIQKYKDHKASIENEIDRLEDVLKEAKKAEEYLRSLTEEQLEYYRVPQHWQSDPHLQYIYGMSNLF